MGGQGTCGDFWGPGIRETSPLVKTLRPCGSGQGASIEKAGRDCRESHPAPRRRQSPYGPCSGEAPALSFCFQDGPADEKEGTVLRIVSLWGGKGVGVGTIQARQPAPLPQCSHVAGICHNILVCCPKELLEQRAVLEQVQLDSPLVSPALPPLTSDPLAALSGPEIGSRIPQNPVLPWRESLFCTDTKMEAQRIG